MGYSLISFFNGDTANFSLWNTLNSSVFLSLVKFDKGAEIPAKFLTKSQKYPAKLKIAVLSACLMGILSWLAFLF